MSAFENDRKFIYSIVGLFIQFIQNKNVLNKLCMSDRYFSTPLVIFTMNNKAHRNNNAPYKTQKRRNGRDSEESGEKAVEKTDMLEILSGIPNMFKDGLKGRLL